MLVIEGRRNKSDMCLEDIFTPLNNIAVLEFSRETTKIVHCSCSVVWT